LNFAKFLSTYFRIFCQDFFLRTFKNHAGPASWAQAKPGLKRVTNAGQRIALPVQFILCADFVPGRERNEPLIKQKTPPAQKMQTLLHRENSALASMPHCVCSM
jgi:hypothetical protein